jgi:hypothetical protein
MKIVHTTESDDIDPRLLGINQETLSDNDLYDIKSQEEVSKQPELDAPQLDEDRHNTVEDQPESSDLDRDAQEADIHKTSEDDNRDLQKHMNEDQKNEMFRKTDEDDIDLISSKIYAENEIKIYDNPSSIKDFFMSEHTEEDHVHELPVTAGQEYIRGLPQQDSEVIESKIYENAYKEFEDTKDENVDEVSNNIDSNDIIEQPSQFEVTQPSNVVGSQPSHRERVQPSQNERSNGNESGSDDEYEEHHVGFGDGTHYQEPEAVSNPHYEEVKNEVSEHDDGQGDDNDDDDAGSNQSFGRNDPTKNIHVTNNDPDIVDFKNALDIKFQQFKKLTIEKYQKIRLDYLQQMDFSIKENERQKNSAVDFMQQKVDEATDERDDAVRRATESRIIFANVMRTKVHTKRAVFSAWKHQYEWSKYKEAKSKF